MGKIKNGKTPRKDIIVDSTLVLDLVDLRSAELVCFVGIKSITVAIETYFRLLYSYILANKIALKKENSLGLERENT